MIVALLLVPPAVWLTWVLFRDDRSVEKTSQRIGRLEQSERERRVDE